MSARRVPAPAGLTDPQPVVIVRDGMPVTGRVHPGDSMSVIGELHRLTPMSADWAMRWEGYAIVPAPVGDVWPDESREGDAFDAFGQHTREGIARNARYQFHDHGHAPIDLKGELTEDDEMTADNCSACALTGYLPAWVIADRTREGMTDPHAGGPNVAWERTYVEAGKRIPAEWADAFHASLEDSSNLRWRACLARSIRTYGAPGAHPHTLALALTIGADGQPVEDSLTGSQDVTR
jgi:hypothetical protein